MPVEKYAAEDLCVVSCQIRFLDNRHLTTFLASEPLAKRPPHLFVLAAERI
jgi:hypothetical protein